MERLDLNRMFEGLSPTPEQERAALDRLLGEERKNPMKKTKRWTALPAAAMLLLALITCAAAVAAGLDQRLVDFFGGGERTERLLLPGAMPVDIAAEDNGAELRVTQVLRDRYTIAVAADFTAPEGTVLNLDNSGETFDGFGSGDETWMEFLAADGTAVSEDVSFTCQWYFLDDGAPADNHLSLLFFLTVTDGLELDRDIAALHWSAKDLRVFHQNTADVDILYAGDWSLKIPLPQTDIGCVQPFDRTVGELDGTPIRLREVYLSPITMMITLEREREIAAGLSSEEGKRTFERWAFALNGEQFAAVNGHEPVVARAVLTDRDGTEIPLECLDGAPNLENLNQYHHPFRLTRAAGVAQLQGGTLTLRIGDGSCEVPLDHLLPVEE